MAKILLDHSDGCYSIRPLDEVQAAELEAQGFEVADVARSVLDAWYRHCDKTSAWQALWSAISHEQHLRRREKELEDAQREISRLKDELERAKQRPREDHVEYTCVFPRLGCQLDALPAEWRARAVKILARYKADYVAEGLTEQGCCCGHAHRKLDEAAVSQLHKAGFLIRHEVVADA
jgi:hypothetical protein